MHFDAVELYGDPLFPTGIAMQCTENNKEYEQLRVKETEGEKLPGVNP